MHIEKNIRKLHNLHHIQYLHCNQIHIYSLNSRDNNPSFKSPPLIPFTSVSAIAIIAGATLGRRNGFMVGALAALTSNFFFGQGMWTPWQMFAWGLVGYVGGALAYAGAFDRVDGTVRMPALLAYGFASGLLYGVVINAYDIIGFVQPLTWAGAVARLATAVPFDITHGLATCVFLAALYKPWCRRINRVVVKYGL